MTNNTKFRKTLLLAPDTLFLKTPDGKYWSDTIYSYDFFKRYMNVFDKIVIASRCQEASNEEVEGYLRSDGPNIEVREMPSMRGMIAYIKNIIPFSKGAKAACQNVDCALIRLPSIPASMVLHYFRKTKRPYALEVVADPYDAYASNKGARLFFSWHLKRACATANGVSYVTKDYLQSKYPSRARLHGENNKFFESYYSTICMHDSYFASARDYRGKSSFEIIHIANNMNNSLKGHEVVIRAAKKVLDDGFDIRVKFVGNGDLRSYFETLTKQQDIEDRVCFTGMLSGADEVREQLLHADLLVFPTQAEGLPRTIIEAMAVGLPCISTPIAGIPELLESEDMLDPLDVNGFANRIEKFLSNPEMMNEKSKRNIEVAREYRDEILQNRRNDFYTKLKNLTDR